MEVFETPITETLEIVKPPKHVRKLLLAIVSQNAEVLAMNKEILRNLAAPPMFIKNMNGE